MTFREMVNKIRWGGGAEETGDRLAGWIVGYFDRVQGRTLEMPLDEFLASEIPEHRARYLSRGGERRWERRAGEREPG